MGARVISGHKKSPRGATGAPRGDLWYLGVEVIADEGGQVGNAVGVAKKRQCHGVLVPRS